MDNARQRITTARGHILAFKEKIDSMDETYIKKVARDVIRENYEKRRNFSNREIRAFNYLLRYTGLINTGYYNYIN
mgnify:CR=1 FL=1